MTSQVSVTFPSSNLKRLHTCSELALKVQRNGAHWQHRLPASDKLLPSPVATSEHENPAIPDPKIFNFESGTHGGSNIPIEFPSVAECAAHLELLAAFYQLRQKVLHSVALDTALGIVPEPRTVYRTKYHTDGRRGWAREPFQVRDQSFDSRRETKWPFYLSVAAQRFLVWAEVVEREMDRQSDTSNVSAIFFPPIDVLMVWHSLLLNPSWFRSFSFKNLSTLPFPWAQIHQALSSGQADWPFRQGERASFAFKLKTGHEADLFADLVNQNHSLSFQKLLQKHGALRPSARLRGLTTQDILWVLNRNNDLTLGERKFWDIVKTALEPTANKVNGELVGAVQRQAAFVAKMEGQLWIRSPALEGTLGRAIDRYTKFVKLFKTYPETMMVPTLDIDLVWHTHQCSAARYEAAMMAAAGRFIDHDDKIGKGTLDNGFERTAKLFRIRFGQEYPVCNCWDCEALRSAVSVPGARNAKGPNDIAREVYETVCFYREVEIARRRGDTLLPIRNVN